MYQGPGGAGGAGSSMEVATSRAFQQRAGGQRAPSPSGPDRPAGVILAPRPWVPSTWIALDEALAALPERAWRTGPRIATGVVELLGLPLAGAEPSCCG